MGKDPVAYVQDLSNSDAALDICQESDLNFNNLYGKTFYCLNFNFQSLIQFREETRIMLTFSFDNGVYKTYVSTRLISIFLEYPDIRINNFFSDASNQENFKSFVINLNFDNYKIAEFDGKLPGNSFSMYFFFMKILKKNIQKK